jgi:deoxyribose-phosphate aldolase
VTDAELDLLVAQIGDEFVARLGRPVAAVPAAAPIATSGYDAPASSAPAATGASDARLAAMIDHTLLRADATRDEILQVCAEARTHGFASVCVNSGWVALVARELRGCSVKTCTVVGFPLGAMVTAAKVFEAEEAIRCGATEVDMVLAVGLLRAGEELAVEKDIRAVAECCHRGGAILKVILETALLNDAQKVVACKLSVAAGADFVKTSTGFSKGGATAKDIALMRQTVGPGIGVKASGGIRTLADARTMIAAGANRIGASASVRIVQESAAQ